jgi:hypothetical protein
MSLERVVKRDIFSDKFKLYRTIIGDPFDEESLVPKFKRLLKKVNHHEDFFIETDLKSGKFSWNYGIQKCLGYTATEHQQLEGDFISEKVHPVVREWYTIYVQAITWLFTHIKTQPLASRFTITVPVKHKDDHYILCKQMSMPFAHDKRKKWVSFLNSYSMFGAYQGEPLKLRIHLGDRKAEDKMHKEMENLIYRCLDVDTGVNLTNPQFSMIEIYADLKHKGAELTSKSVVDRFNAGKTTNKADGYDRKAFTNIKKRLACILGLDPFPPDDKINYRQEYLPDYKNNFKLIDFCEQSDILKHLRKYQLEKNKRKRQIAIP